jgi:uncharacterized integral membrane protein
MIYVKRILLFGLLGLITWFIFQNQGYLGRPVELVFFSFRQTLMLGFWLILSFSAGSLLFMLVDLPKSFALKRELTRKSQELARVQFELNRAQTQIQQAQAPVPGNPPQAAPQTPYVPPLQANPRDMEDRLGL